MKKKLSGGIVYSTNPEFKFSEIPLEEQEHIDPSQQKLRIKLETRNRGGKTVTLIENYTGPQKEKEDLGKKLKSFCGTGGSVKGDEILIQGDNRERILQWLIKNGFTQSRKQ